MASKSLNQIYYLGNQYPLHVKVNPEIKKITIKWDGNTFTCISPEEGEIDISKEIQSFYRKESKRLIEKRLKIYLPHFKVKYRSFKIENSNSKWGSCSSGRHLTFNWKLALFPMEAIDYVVVHELCHMIHMNHDRSFWRLVGKIYPNYKEAMNILGTEKTRDI